MQFSLEECQLLLGCLANVIDQDESGGSEEQLAEANKLIELEERVRHYMNDLVTE